MVYTLTRGELVLLTIRSPLLAPRLCDVLVDAIWVFSLLGLHVHWIARGRNTGRFPAPLTVPPVASI